MPPPHPTTTWSSLQDVFYRKQEFYSLSWGVDLSEYRVAGERFGGLVALVRDDSKLIALGKQTLLKPKILIYTSAGALIETIPWDQGKIVAFGFTSSSRLCILSEDGSYRLYTILAPTPATSSSSTATAGGFSSFTTHSLGTEAAETGVIDARIYEGGLVALTGSLSFVEVRGWEPSRTQVLASAGLSAPPHSWALLTPNQTSAPSTSVIVATSNTILTVDSLSSEDQRLSRGPFLAIAPSPNGRFLALLTQDGKLWVVSADFQRNLSEFDTAAVVRNSIGDAPIPSDADGNVPQSPRQIVWCGDNTVVLAWEEEVYMVAPFGDFLRFAYSSPVHLIGEIDGLRILSKDQCEFLQKVPQASHNVFLPGSTHPGAILLDAFENFERKSPKADEGLRSIHSELAKAVDTCVQAAAYEWEVFWQRKLMKAASFGKSFLDLYNPTEFVDMSRTLRVLNAARYWEIGLSITYDQYTYLFPEALVARLTALNHHLLSLRISSFLDLRPDPVLIHWARAKIARSSHGPVGGASRGARADAEDDEVCRQIVAKFEEQPSVGYAEIARTAWTAGRTRLATKLLDHEARAEDQVPLLLNMQEDKLALIKAVDSGDTDLVYHVLLHLKGKLSRGDFFRLIEAPQPPPVPSLAPSRSLSLVLPSSAASTDTGATTGGAAGNCTLSLAASLLEVYAKDQDRDLLRDFYYQDDRRTESACLALEEGRAAEDVNAKIAKVRTAHKFFSEDKERTLEAKMTDEQARLLTMQQALEKEAAGRATFVGLSVNETIRMCIMKHMSKKADKIKSEFKVPDKRFWYVKIKALIAIRDFDGLDVMAKSKKSPIGYEPFVQLLVQAHYLDQALSYVGRCEGRNRAEMYVLCGKWSLAGKEARTRNDRAKLAELIQRAPSPSLGKEFSDLLDEL